MLSGSSRSSNTSDPVFKRAPSTDSGGSTKRQSSSVSSSSGGGVSMPPSTMIPAGTAAQARYQGLEMESMGRNLSAVPVGLSASRQSFQVALENNPCEYFVDTM